MKQELTKEQITAALKDNCSLTAAAKSLGLKHQEMMKLLKQHGIAVNRKMKSDEVNWQAEYEKMKTEFEVMRDLQNQTKHFLERRTEESNKQRKYLKELNRRLEAYEEGTQYLLKFLPWFIRRRYHNQFDVRTQPWKGINKKEE